MEPHFSNLIHSGKLRWSLFKSWTSIICCLRDMWLIIQGVSMKGLSGRESRLEVLLGNHNIFYVIKLVENWIVWEPGRSWTKVWLMEKVSLPRWQPSRIWHVIYSFPNWGLVSGIHQVCGRTIVLLWSGNTVKTYASCLQTEDFKTLSCNLIQYCSETLLKTLFS